MKTERSKLERCDEDEDVMRAFQRYRDGRNAGERKKNGDDEDEEAAAAVSSKFKIK